jgi:hypothetical protein
MKFLFCVAVLAVAYFMGVPPIYGVYALALVGVWAIVSR